MDAESQGAGAHSAGLEHCAGCRQPFTVPVALLDLIDEGLYLLALHCKNCGRISTGVYEDAELEAFERTETDDRVQMEAALELVTAARMVHETELVLPEDF